MSKAVMLSIRPQWCQKIASGEKTIEVRKTRPKLETPFKGYIYCTMPDAKDPHQSLEIHGAGGKIRKANGEVLGEFVCDCITPLYNVCMDDWKRLAGGLHNIEKELVNQACLTEAKLHTYAGGKNCFAWHISDLRIYEQPRKLEEFTGIRTMKNGFELRLLDRAPQSWCYVEEMKDG
ncbi:hypothetical protein [Hominenteromicrobium sp.]|uniref:hypothetical protein n=1 Tax=Hominenteromicrobium sp. TaxID=3073581 RepID=UPI003A948F10